MRRTDQPAPLYFTNQHDELINFNQRILDWFWIPFYVNPCSGGGGCCLKDYLDSGTMVVYRFYRLFIFLILFCIKIYFEQFKFMARFLWRLGIDRVYNSIFIYGAKIMLFTSKERKKNYEFQSIETLAKI